MEMRSSLGVPSLPLTLPLTRVPPSPRPRERAGVRAAPLPVGDVRQACLTASVVDDLQYPLAVGEILEPELLDEAAVFDQVIAGGLLAAGLVVEGDAGVGQKL